MEFLFTEYTGVLLTAAGLFLVAASIEARMPLKPNGDTLILRYPLFMRLGFATLSIIALFFALAMAVVEREPVIARIGIWSMIGIPTVFPTLVLFGDRIELGPSTVSRSFFGILRLKRSRTGVEKIVYDSTLENFKVYFTDGTVLRVPRWMRGAEQLLNELMPQQA